ncbi:MAG TPA: CinA family protein [Steroidobacteraceae bacterium]
MSAVTDAVLGRLVKSVAKQLRAAEQTIATAESCTGGFLAKCLTDLPGSSDYFERGWVTYSNEAKTAELGVGTNLLEQGGAVNEAVALAMVRGALSACGADHAVAVTGIAGPAGGTPDKPVGTVWIAWGLRRQGRVRVHAEHHRFRGNRDTVRRRTVAAALQGLLDS